MTVNEARKSDLVRGRDVIPRVTAAVETLCVGNGDVRSRLESAVAHQLIPLREQDFPVALRDKFRQIIESTTQYDASDLDRTCPLPFGKSHTQEEGRVQSTTRRIRRRTGARIAQQIWSLHQELLKIAGQPK